MRELLAVEVGGKYVVVPKLIGAMLVVIAAIMIVYATADVVLAWDRIKNVEYCAADAKSMTDELASIQAYQTCALMAVSMGIPIRYDGRAVPDEEKWDIMLPKVAAWLFWITVLIIAVLIFQTGRLIFPVREERVERIEAKEQEKKEEKKKTRRGRARRRKK